MPETNFDQGAVALPQDKGIALRGLWEVFTTPTSFFGKLVTQPKILLPYLTLIVLMVTSVGVTMPYLANDIFSDPQMRAEIAERIANQPGVTMEMAKQYWLYFTMPASMLVYALLPLAVAGLALIWGNFVLGGQSRFRVLLSIVLYAGIVYWLGECLLLSLVVSKGSAMVSISPAILVEASAKSAAYAGLSKLSLFHIWEMVLLMLGFSVALKITKGKSLIVALGSMGLMTLIGLSFVLFN